MSVSHILAASSHVILDGAQLDARLGEARSQMPGHVPLVVDLGATGLEAYSPYLFPCTEPTFARWVMDNGWGKSWGIFIHATCSMEELRKHLRRFLIVKDHQGRRLYFRYYDPRVLRVFLPTCTAAQLRFMFGPVDQFIMEAEDPNKAVVFSLPGERLLTDIIDLTVQDETIPRRLTELKRRTRGDVIV